MKRAASAPNVVKAAASGAILNEFRRAQRTTPTPTRVPPHRGTWPKREHRDVETGLLMGDVAGRAKLLTKARAGDAAAIEELRRVHHAWIIPAPPLVEKP